MLSTKESINLKHYTRTRGKHDFATAAGKPAGYCVVCSIDFTPTEKGFVEPRIAGPCRWCGIVGQCGSVCGDVVALGFRLVSPDGFDLFATGEVEISDLN